MRVLAVPSGIDSRSATSARAAWRSACCWRRCTSRPAVQKPAPRTVTNAQFAGPGGLAAQLDELVGHVQRINEKVLAGEFTSLREMAADPAVRAQVDRVTASCAAAITEVIHTDTGLSVEASRLLAVALVGMAQVSARFWLDGEGELPEEEAASLIASLAWRGISRFPLAEERAAAAGSGLLTAD